MVKQLCFIKSKYFSKRELVLAITIFVIVFSFITNSIFAAQTKISAEQAERIKFALDVVGTTSQFGSILVDGGGLMKALNTVIKGGQTATDVTYGLLVLSAINEMEFIDLVISQDYKDIAKEYFTNVLDERVNLRSYWKGVGFDIPRVLSGNITGPMGALTLNTFAITDKAISIISAFKVLETEKRFDGLWYYFDFRRGGDSHDVAWGDVKIMMNWALEGTSRFRGAGSDQVKELELQFSTLYEKWSPYTTPYGISETYKEQVKSDLRRTIASAVEEHTENGSLYAVEKSGWDKFLAQLENIKNAVASLISQANPFKAGPVAELPEAEPETEQAEVGENSTIVEKVETFQEESQKVENLSQEDLDDILEEQDILNQESESATVEEEEKLETEAVSTTTEAATIETAIEELGPEPEIIEVEPQLCQKTDGGAARQYRVLINEVAWMGNQNSPDNEWIELKNIWGISVNLAGWQLQDKDQQIKIIFKEGDTIPASGYYLLERTDDNSLPDVPADKIYTGALGNTNEALYLFDNNCQLEDEVSTITNWPGGDNNSKKTMQRFDVFSWYTGVVTAGVENDSPPAILEHPSAPAPTPASNQNYLQILITETYIGSHGNEKDDFVEFYNPNSEAVSLTDWYLQRKTETGQDFLSYAPASLFFGKTIGAKSYFLIANASSSISIELIDVSTTYSLTENNTLVAKNPGRDIIDEVLTGNPSAGKSYGRKWSEVIQGYIDNFEIQSPTPKAQNQSTVGDSGGEANSVVINEIAWAGTKANSADEWIELYNNTTSTINLTGWQLAADDGTPNIVFSTSSIPAKGYFLLERTADDTVTDISADQIYTGALSNEGEGLSLMDDKGNLADRVDFTSGWTVGQASPNYISMERVNSVSTTWANNNRITHNGLDAGGNSINGTPKAENSVSKSFTQLPDNFTITEDLILTYFGNPYLVEGSMTVSGVKLTVEPGVAVKFRHVGAANQNSLLRVENGVLEALGTTDRKIIFTSSSTQPQAGDWDGLYLKNSTSSLGNVIVRYGGIWHQPCCYEWPSYTYGAVYIDGGNIQIANSLIEKSGTFGLWLKNSTSTQITGTEFKENQGIDDKPAAVYIESSSPTIKNSVFQNNEIGILAENLSGPTIKDNQFAQNTTPIKITSLLANISGNTFQNNDIDGVLVANFGFSGAGQEISWEKITAPYFIDSALTVLSGSLLKIKPGVEVRLKNNGQINVDGNLDVRGTAQDKIVFTGDSQVPGSWRYIKFSASSTASILENVIVKYGGFFDQWGGGKYGAVKIEGLNLRIEDSVFENNRLAIELVNAGFASQSKDIIVRNNEVGIYVSAGGRPNLSDVTFGIGDDANTYDILP